MNPTPANIAAARRSLDLTQAQAAALLGVIRETWARYECGTRAMSASDWRYWRHVAGIERIPYRQQTKGN